MEDLRNERVLVTGASGFIGRALVERLSKSRVDVAGLCRSAPRAENGAQHAAFMQVDLNEPEAVWASVERFKPTLCYHLAAHPDGAESHEQSHAVLQTNVMGTLNLLEALRRAETSRVVYGCSVKVYGNGPVPYHPDQAVTPNSSYAVAKAAGREMIELYRRLYGMASVSLRPTLVFGPGQGRNIFSFAAGRLAEGADDIPLMGGSQTRAPVYIDDAVDAFIAAGAQLEPGNALDGMAIPISGAEELSISTLVQEMASVAGQRLTPVLIENDTRPTEIFRCFADNSYAEASLGWRPATSLRDGLRKTLVAAGVAVPALHTAGTEELVNAV